MGKVGNLLFWIFILSVHYITVCSFLFVADGSGFFIEMLQTQNFIVHEPLRQFARYITQFPLILSLRLGVTNFQVLTLIFGLGHCIHSWLAIGSVYWLAGWQTTKRTMVIPLIMLVISSGFLISESFVAASYSIIIGTGIINWRKLNEAKQVLIVAICMLFINLYEGGFINGIGLVIMALYHFSTDKVVQKPINKFLQYLVLVLLTSNAAYMAFRAIIAPVNPNGAQIAELDPLYYIAVSAFVAIWWLCYKLYQNNILVVTFLLLTVILGIQFIPSDIQSAYTDRVLILAVPTAIMLAESAALALKRFVYFNDSPAGEYKLVLGILSALLLLKTIPLVKHQHFVARYCNDRIGVIPYVESRKLYVPTYELWWTNIYTSIIYQGFYFNSINSIAGNPIPCTFCYKEQIPATYPKLNRYQVFYHNGLTHKAKH